MDVTLGRMLQEVLDRLVPAEAVRRSRVAAKIAFEFRGDPSTVEERRELLELARREAELAADERAESEAWLATVHALWEPAGAEDRLRASERVIVLARHTHDIDHELEARLARVMALVELWRVGDAEFELAAYAGLAASRSARPGRVRRVPAGHAGLDQRPVRRGGVRHGRLRPDGCSSRRNARRRPHRGMYRRYLADRDCGTDNEVLEAGLALLRALAVQMPGHHFDADVAYVEDSLWGTPRRHALRARALPSLLTSSGYRWLVSAAQAAEVAAVVGSHDACERLYAALMPHQDRLLCMGPGFAGAVRDRLGVLALRLGRPQDAVEHLRRTVAELDEIAALPWVARARVHLAAALREDGDEVGARPRAAAALDTARTWGC